jgi:hypothetical protein
MAHPHLKPDGHVAFANAQAFKDCVAGELSKGLLHVMAAQELAPAATLDVVLEVPGGAPLPLKAEVASFENGEADLCLTGLDDTIRASLTAAASTARDGAPAASPAKASPPKAIAAPPPAAAPVPAAAPAPAPSEAPPAADAGGRIPAFAAKGAFLNPKLPQEFLSLPITRPPTPEQVAHPAMVAVLMWLINRKAEILTLKVNIAAGNRQAEITVVNGEQALAAIPMDAALKIFSEPEGTYEVTRVAAEPKVRYHVAAPTLGLSLLREYTKRYIEPEYAQAMSGRHGQSPKMSTRGKTLVRALGLSDVQLRIANRMLTGQYSLDEVLNNGVGLRSSWQMLFQLQVLGGIDWGEPPPRQNIMVDEMQAMYGRIKGQDCFTAMGLHLSSSPRAVKRMYERLRTMYGPDSASHRLSAKVCEGIWAHMEKCYQVIGTVEGRRAYRAEAFPGTKLDYSARLVYDQARLAMLRGEREFAIDLMEGVLELCPTSEYQAQMQKMGGLSPH